MSGLPMGRAAVPTRRSTGPLLGQVLTSGQRTHVRGGIHIWPTSPVRRRLCHDHELTASNRRPSPPNTLRTAPPTSLPLKYFQARFNVVQDLNYSWSRVPVMSLVYGVAAVAVLARGRGLVEGRRLRVALLQTLEGVALRRRTRTRFIRWSVAVIGVLVVLAIMLSMLPGQLP